MSNTKAHWHGNFHGIGFTEAFGVVIVDLENGEIECVVGRS